jgi:Rap1a immunity proteins
MRKMLIVAASLAFGPAQAEPSKAPLDPEISALGARAMDTHSLDVSYLRESICGGAMDRTMNAKNAEFAACVMYVLGAVDMMREWQKVDPVHALPLCVPRNARAGELILAVQEHIEATAPWQRHQSDAATAVIAALAAKWPCGRRR